MLEADYPWAAVRDPNILIFANLEAANAAYKLVWRLAGAEAIGPILLGMKKPVQSRVLLQRQRLRQGAQELSLSDFEHNPDQALYMDHIRSQDTLGAQELQSTLDQRKRAIALHRIGEQ